MLFLRLTSIASLASALVLDRRQTDQNIPLDEPYCRCMDLTGNSDETLTQAICRGYGGKFAVYDTGNDVYDLQGAVSVQHRLVLGWSYAHVFV